jgi:O-antigen/teichoic acid export membrane protein
LLARSLGAAFLFYRCYLEFGRGQLIRIDRKEIPILLSFGGWVTLTAVLAPLLTMVDRFAIGATLGATYVAIYSVPYQLAQRIAIIPSALSNAMFPKMSSATFEGAGSLAARGTYALLAIMGPPVVVAIFLARPFLKFWIGGALAAQAAPVAEVVLVAFWANAFALMPFVKLQATGRPDIVTVILLVEVPPYLACLYFGLKTWGLQGAALAFAARCLLDYFLLTWAAGKDYRAAPLLLLNLGLLCAALICSRLFPITEWKWSFAAILLVACSAGISVASRYLLGMTWKELI